MGDFNYNLLDTIDTKTNTFITTMFSSLFYPIINKPTRITDTSATLLDHIWTNIYHSSIRAAVIADAISDHLPVIQCTKITKPIISN